MHRAHTAKHSASTAPSARSLLMAGAAVLLLLVCLAAAGWRVSGGKWFVVRTASMGQAAPVGTLLLTRPTSVASVHVGDVISFHAPGSGEIYAHRVVAKTSAGLQTRGDINTVADPWVVTDHDLIGTVVHRWWGVGWVLRALPLLMLCLAVLWLITTWMPYAWRSPVRQTGTAAAFAITSAVLHPWIGVQQVDAATASGGARVRAVSTGIFPVRLGEGSGSVRLVDGQAGSVLVSHAGSKGGYHLAPTLSLSLGWWIVVIALSLAPLAWSLLVGVAPLPTSTQVDDADEAVDLDVAIESESPAARAGHATSAADADLAILYPPVSWQLTAGARS